MVNTGQTAAHPSYVTGFNNVIVRNIFRMKQSSVKFGFNTVSVRNTDVFFNLMMLQISQIQTNGHI